MLTSKEFVAKLEKENEPLFRASELQIKHYYENVTDKDELIDNFTGRMVNERMNMEEISKEVAALPAGTDPEKLILLSKQAHDEAKHFLFVKEVVEYLSGKEKVYGFFVGQIMKKGGGKINPEISNKILRKKLDDRKN